MRADSLSPVGAYSTNSMLCAVRNAPSSCWAAFMPIPLGAGTKTSRKYFGSIASKSNDTTNLRLPIRVLISEIAFCNFSSVSSCAGVRI